MESRALSYRRLGIAGAPPGALVIGLTSVLVVLAMVAVAVISLEAADSHRRAQVLVQQLRASSQEMSALKWRANTEVLAGTADLSLSGPFVRDGVRILSQLNNEVTQLQKQDPGSDTERLGRDVAQLIAGSLQALDATRRSGAASKAALARTQDQFQPILDRLDRDAQREPQHQQAVAAGAIQRSLWASIASVLLGVGLLAVLGRRLASVRRRTQMADELRAVERRSEQRIRALVEHSSDVVTVLGRDLRVRWQAASVRGLLGRDPGSLIEAPITSIAHPDEQALFEGFLQARLGAPSPATLRTRLRHADGRYVQVETIAEDRLGDPAVEGLVLNMRDVSERIAFEDELRHQALHDALTGLANRALFEDRLRHALAARLRTRQPLAVLFLDLDDFKTINDSLGHRAGDFLLQSVAARIEPLLRPTDTAARLGGDEFAVLVDNVDSTQEATEIAQRILAALSDGFTVEDRELRVTASIGIASDGSDADELLRNADMAMYAAKANGKNSVQPFEQTMHRSAVERFELRTELPRALVNDEFYLDYQPIVSLQGGQIAGVEALVRWECPGRGRVAPGQFIGLAEETGLIVPLGRWVLEQACAQAREWELAQPEPRPTYVSVNVSIRQLHEPGFPDSVAEILARSALPPRSLVLEITEGMLPTIEKRSCAGCARSSSSGCGSPSTTSAPVTRRCHTCSSSRSTSSRSTSHSSTSCTSTVRRPTSYGASSTWGRASSSTSSPRASSSHNRSTGCAQCDRRSAKVSSSPGR